MTPENEEKKNYLMRYKWGQMRIAQIEDEIIQLRLSALPGAIKYDGMPHGSGGVDAGMPRYAAMLDELIDKLRKTREQLISELNDVINAINMVEDPRFCILLKYRYIQLKRWEEIASIMGYSTTHVKRMHGEALRAFSVPKDDTF